MNEEIQELKSRITSLEKELNEVWSMLSDLQDALGAEDFQGAVEALTHRRSDMES